jgi:hypothetical protein
MPPLVKNLRNGTPFSIKTYIFLVALFDSIRKLMILLLGKNLEERFGADKLAKFDTLQQDVVSVEPLQYKSS